METRNIIGIRDLFWSTKVLCICSVCFPLFIATPHSAIASFKGFSFQSGLSDYGGGFLVVFVFLFLIKNTIS